MLQLGERFADSLVHNEQMRQWLVTGPSPRVRVECKVLRALSLSRAYKNGRCKRAEGNGSPLPTAYLPLIHLLMKMDLVILDVNCKQGSC